MGYLFRRRIGAILGASAAALSVWGCAGVPGGGTTTGGSTTGSTGTTGTTGGTTATTGATTTGTTGATTTGGTTGGATRVVFVSGRTGNNQIFIMNGDGSNPVNLSNNTVGDFDPALSPDGTRIVFTSLRTGNTEIFVMNSDGSGVTRLTTTPQSTEERPQWSSDGSRIVYKGNDAAGNVEIFVMNANGSQQTRLTNDNFFDSNPVFTPDGRIAFSSQRNVVVGDIYIMPGTGGTATRLTTTGRETDPAVSRDGTRIAFISGRDGRPEIYTMNINGTNQARLTNNAVGEFEPDWSTDMSRIFFGSGATSGNIFSITANGSVLTQLTNTGSDFSPDSR